MGCWLAIENAPDNVGFPMTSEKGGRNQKCRVRQNGGRDEGPTSAPITTGDASGRDASKQPRGCRGPRANDEQGVARRMKRKKEGEGWDGRGGIRGERGE